MKHLATGLLCTSLFLSFPPAGIGSDSAAITLPSPWTLTTAVDYALANNPQTDIAIKRVESSRALTKSVGSGSAPEVLVSASYSQTDNPMYSFGNILNQGGFDNSIDFNDPGRTDDLLLQAEIRYRVYDGGRVSADTEAAHAKSLAEDTRLEIIHQELAFEVVRSYYTILRTREMTQVRKAAVDAIEASLEVGRARYNAGDLLREDLLNLELQKSRAVEESIRAEHDFELAIQTFWNLLGTQSWEGLPLPESAEKQELPAAMNFDNRRELQAVDHLIAAAEADIESSRSGSLPTVDTFAGYQFDHGTILGESGDSWMAGIRLDYALYNGQRAKHQTVAAKSRLLESKAQRKKLRLELSLELQRARIMHSQSLEKLEVTEKMVEVAEESTELNRLRFQEGVILASDLIDMEMRLTDALARRTAARAEHSIAVANLRRTTGNMQFPPKKEEDKQ